jgi:hypothetical protein
MFCGASVTCVEYRDVNATNSIKNQFLEKNNKKIVFIARGT